MIKPSKYVPISHTYLGIGAEILKRIKDKHYSVEELWRWISKKPQVGSYERFALSLDLLFMLDLITLSDGKIKRRVS